MARGHRQSTHSARVQRELRRAILDGTLQPGERLRAAALADRFGLSRTPVREALLTLEREGLVEVLPRRGAMVRQFDGADVVDLYELRSVLEPYAAARAAVRVDAETVARLRELLATAEQVGGDTPEAVDEQLALNDEFHRIVAQSADSPRLVTALQGVALPRAFRTAFWSDEQERTRALLCHREIVAAFEAGRPELAEAAMRVLLLGALEVLRSLAAPRPAPSRSRRRSDGR